jgi:hypothetical protein
LDSFETVSRGSPKIFFDERVAAATAATLREHVSSFRLAAAAKTPKQRQ